MSQPLRTLNGHPVESIEVTYSSIAEVWQATVWLDGGLHESRHNGATAREAFDAALASLAP